MSTGTKWQPGPWRRDDRDTLRDANGRQVLFTGLSLLAGYSPDTESYAANTRLADTAPALYEALIGLLNIEGAALSAADSIGAFKGLDVAYHFDRARAALRAARMGDER